MSRIKPAPGKRDSNEKEIVAALLAVGASVRKPQEPGFPDLSVGFRGVNYLLEVKGPKAELTTDQVTFFEAWQGQAVVVRSVDDALKAIGAAQAED
jgi:hypothetical protein